MKKQAVRQKDAGERPIRVGVSACLLGHEVRYDAGHKRDAFLTETLGRFVEFVPVCPEVELGLGIPRDTLRLQRRGGDVRLIANRGAADYTTAMREYAELRLKALAVEALSGYVLKKNSPSCGMQRVRIYGQRGARSGRGLFAEALIRRWPSLPVEEEGRLNDARIRENFIERVFAYRRLHSFFVSRWTPAGLLGFHTAHKLELLTHSARAYSDLGRLIAGAGRRPARRRVPPYQRGEGNGEESPRESSRAALHRGYEAGFMQTMSKIATPARHLYVLQHMADYIHSYLGPESRGELAEAIADYGGGLVPLIVPIRLLRQCAQRFDIDYLKRQSYLEPHPMELIEDTS